MPFLIWSGRQGICFKKMKWTRLRSMVISWYLREWVCTRTGSVGIMRRTVIETQKKG